LAWAICLILPHLRRRPVDDMAIAFCLIAIAAAITPYVMPLIGNSLPSAMAYAQAFHQNLLGATVALPALCFSASYGLLLSIVMLRRSRSTTPVEPLSASLQSGR
jgi:hypothetical protein